MKSSKCDKWVFIMFGTSGNYAFAKWIKLPRGVWVSIDETFVAKIDADSMFYGIGGEMGDRTGIDYDAEIRYSYAPDGPSSVVDGDSSVATQITCSDMVLALKSDIDKIDGKNQETEQPTTQPQEQETTVRLQEQVTTTKNIVKADNKDKKPKASSIKKIKKAKKSLKVTWKKVKNVKGYQLQYSTSKKFKKAKTVTVKKAKTTSKTIKKLKAKKKYYVRIRTYITVNGKKQYSDWSKAKSQKTK